MGGRGSSSGGGGTTGGKVTILNTESMLSYPNKRDEINETMAAIKAVHDQYGVDLSDIQVATLASKNANVMAYYDSAGNLAINKTYFDSNKMNAAYDRCVNNGFHPSRGNKSGLEATAAHEMGHRLTQAASRNDTWGQLDSTADSIVSSAAKKGGFKSTKALGKAVSGYGAKNSAEAIAEAFSDVHCNGRNASRASRLIITELNSRLLGGKKK